VFHPLAFALMRSSTLTHSIVRLAGALAILLAGAAGVGAQAGAPAKRLRVVATSDVHGHLLSEAMPWSGGRKVGGMAVLAAYFDSARATFSGPTLVLSSGDDMQGTTVSNLSGGRAAIDAMNAAGYDAAALGNHEFDWGLDSLRARIRQSRFPWLAANLYVAGTTRNPDWVKPWVMIERGGVRTAVVGVALASTPRVVMAGRVAGLDFGPEAPAIDRSAREARTAGADFVIVAVHDGAWCESPGSAPAEESSACHGDLLDVVRALTEPVDLVLGGHSHRRVLTSIGRVPVLEPAAYSSSFAVVDLERTGGATSIARRAVQVAWADSVSPDTVVSRIVDEWDRRVRAVSDRPVASFAAALDTVGGDFALGRLMADAYRSAGHAQAALVNDGSVRRGLPAGTITFGDLYELQPFQNQIVVQEVSGAQLRAALENALGRNGKPDANLSGLTVWYDPAAPAGKRVRSVRLDDGLEVRDGDMVSLASSEFVATGGDGYTVLRELPSRGTGTIDVNALIAYLRSLPQPVVAPPQPRWVPVR
jgi:2',3'-cyclic-nucleotide 2'-phosphodiesterase (5'-nucleotidase family)